MDSTFRPAIKLCCLDLGYLEYSVMFISISFDCLLSNDFKYETYDTEKSHKTKQVAQ